MQFEIGEGSVLYIIKHKMVENMLDCDKEIKRYKEMEVMNSFQEEDLKYYKKLRKACKFILRDITTQDDYQLIMKEIKCLTS